MKFFTVIFYLLLGAFLIILFRSLFADIDVMQKIVNFIFILVAIALALITSDKEFYITLNKGEKK
jgi:hypothetical protein